MTEANQKEVLTALGQRIKTLRAREGMSQEALSVDSGLTRMQISRIEQGNINTSVLKLCAIAEAFGMSLSQLVDISELSSTSQ